MSVSPTDFFELAKALGGDDPKSTKEIRGRTAVSRAYYGAFHAALSFADTHKAPRARNTDSGLHQQLFDRLEQLGKSLPAIEAKFLMVALEMLRNLKEWRTDADYKLQTPHGDMRAVQALDLANRCCRKLGASVPNSTGASSP